MAALERKLMIRKRIKRGKTQYLLQVKNAHGFFVYDDWFTIHKLAQLGITKVSDNTIRKRIAGLNTNGFESLYDVLTILNCSHIKSKFGVNRNALGNKRPEEKPLSEEESLQLWMMSLMKPGSLSASIR